MSRPARIAVFASGGGTNLQALLDRFNTHPDPIARVEVVIGSREGIGALDRAARIGVAGCVIDGRVMEAEACTTAILEELDRHRIDFIALAGYLKLVPPEVVERYRGRILNIHPALLPAFGGAGMFGLHVHRAVIDSGATVSGATVHLVDERYDEGRILLQWPVPVLRGDSPEQLAERVLRVEHILYPLAIEHLVRGDALPPSGVERAFELSDLAAPSEAMVRRLLE